MGLSFYISASTESLLLFQQKKIIPCGETIAKMLGFSFCDARLLSDCVLGLGFFERAWIQENDILHRTQTRVRDNYLIPSNSLIYLGYLL